MITFDLACDRGHRFEGWFGNAQGYEDQLARGLLECPLCGSRKVTKQLSAVAVHVGRRTASAAPPAPSGEGQPARAVGLPSAPPGAPSGPPKPEAFLRAVARFVETHFEDVGPSFAAEARKIDAGEAEQRNIRGTTTAAEEEALQEEGVEFFKVALPKYDA